MGRMTEANDSGDRLVALRALADELAHRLDSTEDVRTIASLARQYRETLNDIAEATGVNDEGGDVADLIRRKQESL